MNPTQVCILGGGFSGLYTALCLNRLYWTKSKKPQIILIDKEERFLFTPFLYELVTGELKKWEMAPLFQKLLVNKSIQFYQGTIQKVDLKKRQVQLQGGKTFSYNYLVLAVGRETSLNVVPGAATYAYSFRTLADAERLLKQLQVLEASERLKIRVAIAGGGSSGVELAGKLADRLKERGQVRLIERGEKILKGFSAFSQKVAYRSLAVRGVQINLETSIKSVDANQITLVHQGQVDTIPVDLAIWTAGTQSRKWLLNLACEHNSQNQLLTLPTLQLVGYPEVFALGDLADISDARGKKVPATAQAAFQQASCAACNLRAVLTKRPLRGFRYLHMGEMLTLGIKDAALSSFGINLKGAIASVSRRLIYLLLRMPTLRHRLEVGRHWLKRLFLGGIVKFWQRIKH